jgi:hypothetical protein
MPHATSNPQPDGATGETEDLMNEESLLARALDVDFTIPDLGTGEKADDAIDYEDISDSELPDDEDAAGENGAVDDDDLGAVLQQGIENLNDQGPTVEMDLDDDLFGDSEMNNLDYLFSDTGAPDGDDPNTITLPDDVLDGSKTVHITLPTGDLTADLNDVLDIADEEITKSEEPDAVTQPEADDEEVNEQMRLFAMSKKKADRTQKLLRGEALDEDDELPPVPETDIDLVEQLWPRYRTDETPRFVDLFAPRNGQYLGKVPPKPPKPVLLQKVSLQLEQDQERQFTLISTNTKKRRRDWANDGGVIYVGTFHDQQTKDDDLSEPEAVDDDEVIGNVTMQDLRLLCNDWDTFDFADLDSQEEPVKMLPNADNIDLEYSQKVSSAKRLRTSNDGKFTLPMYLDEFQSWDDPEQLTAKIASRIYLDLNDPLLLIDTQSSATVTKSGRSKLDLKETADGIRKTLERKFNFSKDDDYELLKENHSNKVRSTLANVALEHSLPALKLQFPYYKVKLDAQDARAFHRPSFGFPVTSVKFEQSARYKVKNMRGVDAQNLYKTSDDLTMADNSTMLLVEYSEEYPMMLSNFGMANKLINYYRRTDEEDRNRPKREIGETQVLLPQDKSPFAAFGYVDPGKITQTFHNAMYRTPVYKHDPKSTDFLCIRTSKGGTAKWYLRNLDNLFVAGQQFPSMQIPGTHSRKVTDASKRRLRMIAYRIYKKNLERRAKEPLLSNDMMKEHLLGADTGAVRSKMREFMAYDKHKYSWYPKPGEVVPDEEAMRAWIKPEDICMLDSMQVGDQHLRDVGFNRDESTGEHEEDENESASLDERLAPWFVTKHFLEATTGKAMLELHGEGDPTGRGEGFSLLKTSMKGGFKAIGESINDHLDAKRVKDLNGHSYNVKQQEKSYNDAIERIWLRQQESLSSIIEHSDVEPDVDDDDELDYRESARTPRSQGATPSVRLNRRDDETSSQFSKYSTNSQTGKSLKITRKIPGKAEPEVEIVTDPKVIRAYLKKRRAIELQKLKLDELVPTGQLEEDARRQKALLTELQRLQHNQERRVARERAKGVGDVAATPGTPGDAAAPVKAGGTTRKCANCGQIGHIKTNKKACPLLNGQIKVDQNGFNNAAFATPATPVGESSAASPAPPS